MGGASAKARLLLPSVAVGFTAACGRSALREQSCLRYPLICFNCVCGDRHTPIWPGVTSPHPAWERAEVLESGVRQRPW
jgi:hypothetical protein